MTIIIAMAVLSEKEGKPYILFGSDSLQVDYELIRGKKEVIGKKENQQKVFKFNDNLIAFMGVFDTDVVYALLDHLNNFTARETGLGEILELVKNYILSHLSEPDTVTENITVIVGKIESDFPKLVMFEATKNFDIEWNAELMEVIEMPDHQFYVSGEQAPPDLAAKLSNGINQNDSIESVTKNVSGFLKEVASIYPETCNQNIRIMHLV